MGAPPRRQASGPRRQQEALEPGRRRDGQGHPEARRRAVPRPSRPGTGPPPRPPTAARSSTIRGSVERRAGTPRRVVGLPGRSNVSSRKRRPRRMRSTREDPLGVAAVTFTPRGTTSPAPAWTRHGSTRRIILGVAAVAVVVDLDACDRSDHRLLRAGSSEVAGGLRPDRPRPRLGGAGAQVAGELGQAPGQAVPPSAPGTDWRLRPAASRAKAWAGVSRNGQVVKSGRRDPHPIVVDHHVDEGVEGVGVDTHHEHRVEAWPGAGWAPARTGRQISSTVAALGLAPAHSTVTSVRPRRRSWAVNGPSHAARLRLAADPGDQVGARRSGSSSSSAWSRKLRAKDRKAGHDVTGTAKVGARLRGSTAMTLSAPSWSRAQRAWSAVDLQEHGGDGLALPVGPGLVGLGRRLGRWAGEGGARRGPTWPLIRSRRKLRASERSWS